MKKPKYRWIGAWQTYNGRWKAGLAIRQPDGTFSTMGLGTHDRELDAARAVYDAAKVHRPDLDLPYPEEGP